MSGPWEKFQQPDDEAPNAGLSQPATSGIDPGKDVQSPFQQGATSLGTAVGNNLSAGWQGEGKKFRDTMAHPGTALSMSNPDIQRTVQSAQMAIPVETGAALLPSVERAGKGLEEVKTAIGGNPINIANPLKNLNRAQELEEAGGTMPKVMRDFGKRTAVQTEGDVATKIPPPVTFSQGRDFYSNAGRLSASEAAGANPPMMGQVKQFAKSLGESLQEAADAAGQGSKYSDALNEYRHAKSLGEAVDVVKKWGLGALITGAAAKAGWSAAEALGVSPFRR